MAIEVSNITRQFSVKRADGSTVTLEDPNVEMSVKDVMEFYSNNYPELITSTVKGPSIDDGVATYEFVTTVGTKG